MDKKVAVIANMLGYGMLGYYIYSIAKPGGSILNQRMLTFEKEHIEFLLRENYITNS